jgi:hypothetical protein
MIRDTSAAVDDVVAIVRTQMGRIREQLAAADMAETILLEGRFLQLAAMVREIENNRANVLVAFIAGRRGLDKLPEADLEILIRCMFGGEAIREIEEAKP